jgi:hypothetical protein
MQQTGLFWPEGIPHIGASLRKPKTKKKVTENSDFLTEKKPELEAMAKTKLITRA